MPLVFGVTFLVASLLTCLVPISLLLCFATFFTRTARRMPPNATPVQPQRDEAQRGDPKPPEQQV